MFNVSQIRQDFPIFNRKINGMSLIYLDSTASTLKPQQVIAAQNAYYQKYSVNIFRGIYKLSEEATEKYEQARSLVAQFLNATNEKEIIFVRNATEAVNLVASTWGNVNIDGQSHIILTLMEHHANLVPWQQLAKQKNATIKYLDFDKSGILDLSPLEKMVDKNTRLVALTYISNVLGTINPVKKIISRIKRLNPKTAVLLDAAQAVPHLKVNVKDLNCDFLVFSGHKMLAPTGIGVLWGRYDLLDSMPPYQFGGEMIQEVYLDRSTFKAPPYKFEAGTPHIAGAIGLGEAINYLNRLGMDNVRAHEQDLIDYAIKRLANIKNIVIYGPQDAKIKGGVVAFNIEALHPHDIAQVLDSDNICIRSGHHCAMPLHHKLNIPASCRASFYIYNDRADIDRLIENLEKARKLFL